MLYAVSLLQFLLIPLCYGVRSKVLELTDSDFYAKVDEHRTVLVMFYAPWCGHCKELKPHFEVAAETLASEGVQVRLAKVDCTSNKRVCRQFLVSGYPTLYLFDGSRSFKRYKGPRDSDGIEEYMREEVKPAVTILETESSLETLLSEGVTTVIGFFKDDSEEKSLFDELVRRMDRKVSMGLANFIYKEEFDDKIVLFRPKHLENKFEESILICNGKSINELESFVLENRHGLVGHRRRNNEGDFKNPLVVAYYAVDFVKNSKSTNYWRNRIMLVAKEFQNNFNFAISSLNEFPHDMTEFGHDFDDDTQEQPLIFVKDANGKKFKMTEEFSVDNLKTFLLRVQEGKLKPYLKSEAPYDNKNRLIKLAVADDFEDVISEDRDILLEFYAPWCGHCKKLNPILEELAKKMLEEEVRIVKMDATKNDMPSQFKINGYPTLFWLPKDSKDSFIQYKEQNDLNSLISFIAKHSTEELKQFDREGNMKIKEEL